MKFTYRICAAVLSAVILLGSVCSCGVIPAINNNGNTSVDSGAVNSINVLDQVSTKTAPAPVIPNYSGRNTLNVAIDAEIATLSPFFAETDAELIAAGLAFTRLINIARGGVPIVQGMDGQKVEYLGTEYEYQGIADVKVTKNADGTADYAFTLREDAFFSDGTNITADDVIFSMYVLLDPSYRGYSDLGELPIVGLDEYRAGMMSLADRIYYTEGEEVSSVAASDVKRFRDTLAAVYGRYAEGVMRYVREEYSADTLRKYAGKWTDKVESEDYLRAIAMVMLGCADWQKDDNGQYTGTLVTADGGEFGCIERFPSDSDLFSSAAKSTDTLLGIDSLCPEGKLEDVLREAFGDEYDTFFEVRRAFGSRTDSVSGIIKTGMYTFTVRLDRYDASDIYGFSFFVAPLHTYGSRDGYKYTENRFGFSKGDTVEIRNAATRVSSGAYFFKSERDGAYRFERNQLYYLGCPNVRYIDLIPAEEGEDVVAAIADGKYDLAARELDEQIMTRLDTVNREGNKVSSVTYGNGGYGYIGINCDNVNIPEDETVEASASLRRALCVLLSLYSDIAAETFLPKGYTTADGPVVTGTYSLSSAESVHSLNVRDEDIYKDGMTVKQKKAAASVAALEYLEKAGYILNDAGTRIISAPDGRALEFELLMLRGERHSAYLTEIVKNTSDALADIGITLRVEYADGVRDIENRLVSGNVQIWAYDRMLPTEPRLVHYYHSEYDPKNTDRDGENYSRVSDGTLDRMLAEAYGSDDRQSRAGLICDAVSRVYRLGAEIPLYHRNSVMLISSSVYGGNAALRDATSCYNWIDSVHTLLLP